MNYDFVLALDPSGAYTEGKGTTGWCVLESAAKKITKGGSLTAISYPAKESYWEAHVRLIDRFYGQYDKRLIVVIEDYLLYENKAGSQINSRMETCKLIGILQHHCFINHIPYTMQLAGEVKNRWTNDILAHKKYITYKQRTLILPATKEPLNRHSIDAVRHAVHFDTFKNHSRKVGQLV